MNISWDELSKHITTYAVDFGLALIIFIVGQFAAHLTAHLVEKAVAKTKGHKTLASFMRNLVYYAIMTFVLIAALNKLGIQTGSIIAVLGAASLAVGLALQGSLSNFAAGVMLILFHPFEVDDTIEAAGVQGKVTEIQIFNTILVTTDLKKVILPNSKITADKITVFPR